MSCQIWSCLINVNNLKADYILSIQIMHALLYETKMQLQETNNNKLNRKHPASYCNRDHSVISSEIFVKHENGRVGSYTVIQEKQLRIRGL